MMRTFHSTSGSSDSGILQETRRANQLMYSPPQMMTSSRIELLQNELKQAGVLQDELVLRLAHHLLGLAGEMWYYGGERETGEVVRKLQTGINPSPPRSTPKGRTIHSSAAPTKWMPARARPTFGCAATSAGNQREAQRPRGRLQAASSIPRSARESAAATYQVSGTCQEPFCPASPSTNGPEMAESRGLL